MWNLIKKNTTELIYKTEIDADLENEPLVTGGEGPGRDRLGVWG